MGARGAVIMGFFGAVFAALTMHLQWQLGLIMLTLPFIVFLIIGAAAMHTMGLRRNGIVLSDRTLPIAHAASFRPFYILGAFLLLSAVTGFLVASSQGGGIAGIAAALSLWLASTAAIGRDHKAKRASLAFG